MSEAEVAKPIKYTLENQKLISALLIKAPPSSLLGFCRSETKLKRAN